jgi:LysM repeat protein
MPVRRSGRYLALLALVAVIVATALVVRSGLGSTHHPSAASKTRLPVTSRKLPKHRFYVIRPGDTLSAIAAKTGVSVGELQTLNPSLAADPNALQTGQRLRLR